MQHAFRLGLAVLMCAAAHPSHAAVRYVKRDNPTPVPPYTGGWTEAATNIQDAVDYAVAGDTVLVTNGLYDAGGRGAPGDTTLRSRVVITNAITVISVNGPEGTYIVGEPIAGGAGGLGNNACRGVYLTNNAVLSGFTVTNGFTRGTSTAITASYVGGGIRAESLSALITNCVIVANVANARGGGVYSGTLVDCYVGSNAVISGSTGTPSGGGGLYGSVARNTRIERNRATGLSSHDGGGAWGGALLGCVVISNATGRNGGGVFGAALTNCTVEANTAATSGGGAYTPGTVSNCVIRGNTALSSGGGVYQGVIVDSLLASNRLTSTTSDGGGFYGGAAGHRLVGCSVIGNEAVRDGGGVYNAVLSNCVVRANHAIGNSISTGRGGGFGANNAIYGADCCYFLDNVANYQGGGAYQGRFFSCVFSGNRAHQAGGYYGAVGYQLNSCTVLGNSATNNYGGVYAGTYSNCIVYANSAPANPNFLNSGAGGTFVNSCTTPLPTTGSGNVVADPLVSGYRDPHLLPGSPCIGAGVATAWMTNAVDIDGEARVTGGVTDIGADQHTGSALDGQLAVSLVVATNVCTVADAQTFLAEAQGQVGSLTWNFGDGSGASGVNPASHAFGASGVYTVTVTVSNATHSASATREITVIDYLRFVSPFGSHTPPFDTWATAATNIQAAVDAVAIAGGRVLVTNGVYDTGSRVAAGQAVTNRVTLDKSVRVESVNGPEVTAIVGRWHSPAAPLGGGALRGVFVGGEAVLAGFTVSNGATFAVSTVNNGRGGGIFLASGGVATNCVVTGCRAWSGAGAASESPALAGTLRGCTLVTNVALTAGNTPLGGGAANLVLAGCAVLSNVASSGGGAYACTLSGSTLAGNSAASQGGGAWGSTLDECELRGNVLTAASGSGGGGAYFGTLRRCRLYDNVALNNSQGGGAYDSTLFSCVLAGNTAYQGGGVYGSTAGRGLFGCTVVGNAATASATIGGGGVYGLNGTNYAVRSCIVYHNTATQSNNLFRGTVQYTCAEPLQAGVGNLAEAPQVASFERPVLLSGSPCVGQGLAEAWMAGTLDFEGDPRTTGGAADMGADQTPVEADDDDLSVSILGPAWPYFPTTNYTFEAEVGGHPDVLYWDFGDGTVVAGEAQVTHAWPEGEYTLRLTVSNASHSAQASLTIKVEPDTRYVSPSGSHTPPFRTWATAATNLQDAADALASNGRIKIAAGVYDRGGRPISGQAVTNRLHVGIGIAVIGVDGPESTVIVGAASGAAATNGLGEAAVRGVYLAAGSSLQGVTVAGGRTRWSASATSSDFLGGGVYCYDGTCEVRGCVVSNCAAAALGGGVYQGRVYDTAVEGNAACATAANTGRGGGVYNAAALSNCVVRGNSAGGAGGGAYVDCAIADTLFDGNVTSGSGGGCFVSVAGTLLLRCTLAGNVAATYGGGAMGCAMTDCLLTNNAATRGGGYYASIDLTLLRCRLLGNRAAEDGGGAYHGNLYTCRVIGNTAGESGGGLALCNAYGCAVARNTAGQTGGGCYLGTLEHSTVAGNSAASGGGCYGCTAYYSVVYYNAAASGAEYFATDSYGCCTTPYDPYATTGVVTAPPQLTGWSDPHLLPGSPCVDAGDYRPWLQGANGFDLDGEARYGVPFYDIGADERCDATLSGPLAVSVSADQTAFGLMFAPEFRAEATGRVGDLIWDFGDGTSATNQNPVRHAFPALGEYTVRATVTNQSGGASGELTVTVSLGYVYVSKSGGSVAPFASWADAATNIQDAVDAAIWGGTVWVTNGVYDLGGRPAAGYALTNRVCVEKPLVLRSVEGPAHTAVMGAWNDVADASGPAAVRGVWLGSRAVMIGIAVTNAATLDSVYPYSHDHSAGGVYVSADAAVSNCWVSGCYADAYGGGGYGGSWTDCRVFGNRAYLGGGLAYALVYGGAFEGNASDSYGGGLLECGAKGCTLSGNTAVNDGGGVYNNGEFGGWLDACVVTGNSAGGNGGGAAYMALIGCQLVGNHADVDGGGAYGCDGGGCQFSSNTASSDGGGACQGLYTNTVFSGNAAQTGNGGGYSLGSGSGSLHDCTLADNTAALCGGGCYEGTLYDCVLTNNAAQNGGGYYVRLLDASGALYRCRLWDNVATVNGGGTYGGTLYSSVLAGNRAGQNGGGMYEATLESSTVCGNVAGEQAGGCQGGQAYNSIVYYNEAPWGVDMAETVSAGCCTPGGAVAQEPRVAGFYVPHLLPLSPCVDAGIERSWFAEGGAFDMEQDARVAGVRTDIGADETSAAAPSGALVVRVFADTLSIAAGYAQTFRAEVTGAPAYMLWSFGDGAFLENNNPVEHTFASTGVYTVRVTATNSTHGAYAEIQVTVVASDVYVATGGSHEAPFVTWETAATNIQNAVDAAPWGGTVWVGDGTYELGGRPAAGQALTNRVCVVGPVTVRSLNGPSAVTIRGAWHSPETACGAGAVRGVYLGHPEARLLGVTVDGAATSGSGETDGGGVYSRYVASVVSNCLVSGCTAAGDGGGAWGGSWYDGGFGGNLANDGGGACAARLTRCTVSGNTAFWYGGGLLNGSAADSSIEGNEIIYGDGGGGGLKDSDALRCVVQRNSSAGPGGGALGGALVNCLIADNDAATAGGASEADLVNCTVTANEAVADVGGVGSCSVLNSIVWGNVAPAVSNAYTSTFEYSLTTPPPAAEYDLGGNLDADPQFVNPAGGNYRLRGTSPCVDAGTNVPAVVGATDLAGDARFYNGVIDMGAYEYAPVEGYAALGTPISWLDDYFAGPDWDAIELDDPDNDGFPTWQEFISLTDPTSDASYFSVRDVAYGASGADVSFDTALGRVYTVQHSLSLTPVSWLNAAVPVTGTGGRMTVTVPDTEPVYFYRVRVSLP